MWQNVAKWAGGALVGAPLVLLFSSYLFPEVGWIQQGADQVWPPLLALLAMLIDYIAIIFAATAELLAQFADYLRSISF